jgi:hypothetical protein
MSQSKIASLMLRANSAGFLQDLPSIRNYGFGFATNFIASGFHRTFSGIDMAARELGGSRQLSYWIYNSFYTALDAAGSPMACDIIATSNQNLCKLALVHGALATSHCRRVSPWRSMHGGYGMSFRDRKAFLLACSGVGALVCTRPAKMDGET